MPFRDDLLFTLGRSKEATDSLRQAGEIAQRFDAAPDYAASALRFVSGQIPASSIDDLGDTAMSGVEHIVAELDNSELREMWAKLREET